MEEQLTRQPLTNLPATIQPAWAQSEYSTEPQSGSLLDYWHALRRRKRLLAVCSIAGLAIGIAATLPQAPLYRATTTLEIQEANGDTSAAKILNPTPDRTPTDALTDTQTQVKILESRGLIKRALEKAHIVSTADLDSRTSGPASWFGFFSSSVNAEDSDAVAEKAAKHLKISAVSQTRIVEVSFDSTDAALAARVANALTSEFIKQNLEARWQMNDRTSQWLVGQLDEVRTKLQRSEDALQAYARAAGLMYTGDEQTVSGEKLRQLQLELSKAQADRVDKESRMEITRSATPESIPEVLNDGNLRALEANLTELHKQQAEMSITFKPDYTKAKRIHAEIEMLTSDIDAKRAVVVRRLENELRESQRREQMLTAAYAKQRELVSDDAAKSIQYDMLKHEVDTNRQIYQVMLQRVKEASIESALKATNVRVLDPAIPPQHPYKPNMPLNSAAGLLCGLMLGAAATIVSSKADGSIHEPGEAGALLGIPELGVIPTGGPLYAQRLLPLPLMPGEDNAGNTSMPMVAYSSEFNQTGDDARAILASILFAGANEQQKVLVFTSASPGEGKTTASVNLAMTLANMNRRVLLIDGDIRNGRIHDIFRLANRAGLTSLLKQGVTADTDMDAFVQETSIPNLHVLPSGPPIQSGAALLFSASMPALVARYREEYDMILIDTPPMLMMPDARVIGRVADAVVLVARAGQTTRTAIQAAHRRFLEDQTPVIGIVLNDWNAKTSSYQHYATYKEQPMENVVGRSTAAGA